jgi:hypothetical protein
MALRRAKTRAGAGESAKVRTGLHPRGRAHGLAKRADQESDGQSDRRSDESGSAAETRAGV